MEWREREESATIPVYCLIKSSLSGRPPSVQQHCREETACRCGRGGEDPIGISIFEEGSETGWKDDIARIKWRQMD